MDEFSLVISIAFNFPFVTVSPRLLEAPLEGPAKGITIAPKFDQMIDWYYEGLGWDKAGKPLPETLKRLGLESVAKELWG